MNVYDFDNTILRGDSSFLFLTWCYRRPRTWRCLPKAAWKALLYALKLEKFEGLKEALFAAAARMPKDTAREFWDGHMERIKPFYLSRMRDDDVIVTASPEFLVKEAVKRLGKMRVIGTVMDPETGKISGRNCKREEKTVRFSREYPEAQIDAFYSDSRSDDPMARLSKEAFLVKGEAIARWPER